MNTKEFNDLISQITNNKIEKVYIGHTTLTIEQIQQLSHALSINTSITSLQINSCQLTDSALYYLTGLKNIKALNLDDNFFTERGMEFLKEKLKDSKTLESLSVSRNKINDFGIESLSELLLLPTLYHLDVSSNEIGNDGVNYLIENLNQSHLKTLNLSFNLISDEGINLLAETLTSNVVLEKLDVSRNQFGDEGAKSLAAMLQMNVTLDVLEANWHRKMTNEGLQAFATSILKNVMITSLLVNLCNVDGDEFPSPHLQTIQSQLLINRNFKIFTAEISTEIDENKFNIGTLYSKCQKHEEIGLMFPTLLDLTLAEVKNKKLLDNPVKLPNEMQDLFESSVQKARVYRLFYKKQNIENENKINFPHSVSSFNL